MVFVRVSGGAHQTARSLTGRPRRAVREGRQMKQRVGFRGTRRACWVRRALGQLMHF